MIRKSRWRKAGTDRVSIARTERRREGQDAVTQKLQTRCEELDYFNACACILVVLIHVLSPGISGLQPGSWQMAVIYFPWRISGFVVPAFLFCGAVKLGLLFASGREFHYGRYIRRRIIKIYIPYLAANAVYYAVFLRIHYVAGDFPRELIKYILLGNLSSPFYYVVIVMQFYLLAPVWRALEERLPWYIGLLSALFFTFLSVRTSSVLRLFGVEFPYADRIFPSYLWFWMAGLYAGKYYDRVQSALQEMRWKSCVYMAAVCGFFALLSYLQFSSGQHIYDLDTLKVFSDSLAVLLLLRVCTGIRDGRREWPRRLGKGIHSASYFVYLYHCLFLTYGTVYLHSLGIKKMPLLLFLRAVIAYGAAFGLYFLFRAAVRRLSAFKPGR